MNDGQDFELDSAAVERVARDLGASDAEVAEILKADEPSDALIAWMSASRD